MDANKRRERAAAEAAEWWVRIESSELSREHREAFVDWLRESAVHVAEMIRMAEVHGALEHFADWDRVSTEGWDAPENVISLADAAALRQSDTSAARTGKSQPQSPRRWWLAGAAAAALAVLGAWLFLSSQSQLIETGRGERRGVTLADGSVVQIDPQSRLRIRFEKHRRNIELERGRVLFRVAHDTTRPFIVHAGVTQVRAVGTQFGVEQAREGIVVTVAEGKVIVLPQEAPSLPFGAGASRAPATHEVSSASGSAHTDTRAPAGEGNEAAGTSSPEVLLSAGQQITVPKVGPAEAVKRVDSERELAWAAGRLVFDNDSVADIVEQFNRYNVVQLHVPDRQLAAREVSGVFDASEPESFIAFVKSVNPVRVSRTGQDITIAPTP